jgi:hypothetical protein
MNMLTAQQPNGATVGDAVPFIPPGHPLAPVSISRHAAHKQANSAP